MTLDVYGGPCDGMMIFLRLPLREGDEYEVTDPDPKSAQRGPYIVRDVVRQHGAFKDQTRRMLVYAPQVDELSGSDLASA